MAMHVKHYNQGEISPNGGLVTFKGGVTEVWFDSPEEAIEHIKLRIKDNKEKGTDMVFVPE